MPRKKKVVPEPYFKEPIVLENLKQTPYVCVLNYGGQITEYQAETILECLEQIKVPIIKARSTITVSQGTKVASINLMPALLKRLILNKGFRLLIQKRFLGMLK